VNVDGRMSRRTFLAASGGLVLATSATASAGASLATKPNELSALLVSIDPYASPDPQRIGLAIFRGARPVAGPRVNVALAAPGTDEATVVTTKLYTGGLPGGRGVYVFDAVLPEPGDWRGIALVGGKRVGFRVAVSAGPTAPAIGAAAPRAASPTKADPLGTKPLCTRVPPCPLHTTSLSDLVGSGRPVAAMFATPALCQTATCGPVLDQLLEVRAPYEDRVAFVHVEIYKTNKGTALVPTVDAWQLPGEPWLYTVDGSGIVQGRLDGAFGRKEIVQELDDLVAPG
jgi:hypothetical protein